MDAIAKAVNSFTSETVQHEAFAALMAAFEGGRHRAKATQTPPSLSEQETQRAEPAEEAAAAGSLSNGSKVPRSRRAGKDTRNEWKMVRDLDLRPEGKQSFADFIEVKQPASNEDRYAVVVYYLSEILGMDVNIHQVGTVFRLTKEWKEPTALASGLRVAASRKGTVSVSNEEIKLTPAGRNFVEHDLPPRPKKSK
jgi:hypothetical protein